MTLQFKLWINVTQVFPIVKFYIFSFNFCLYSVYMNFVRFTHLNSLVNEKIHTNGITMLEVELVCVCLFISNTDNSPFVNMSSQSINTKRFISPNTPESIGHAAADFTPTLLPRNGWLWLWTSTTICSRAWKQTAGACYITVSSSIDHKSGMKLNFFVLWFDDLFPQVVSKPRTSEKRFCPSWLKATLKRQQTIHYSHSNTLIAT